MNPADLRRWDNEFVWHPFTPMQTYRDDETPIIVAGEGFELIDVAGKRYLDGVSSLWCNVHGHRVPEIDQAIREQLDRIGHSTLLGLANEPSIRLANPLSIFGERVFWSCELSSPRGFRPPGTPLQPEPVPPLPRAA